ncbi:pyridoxamine 5'-phosphate oxidase, partial [Phenoliferia sp. Uapishka_3]
MSTKHVTKQRKLADSSKEARLSDSEDPSHDQESSLAKPMQVEEKRLKVNSAKLWMDAVEAALTSSKNKDNPDTMNIVLATVKDGQPYARYHVHRGFVKDLQDLDTEYLYTTTDLRMPKVEQIESSASSPSGGAPGEYVFWMSGSGDQIRVRGYIHLYPCPFSKTSSVEALIPGLDWEAKREQEWAGLSSHLRASFQRPKPGSEWPEGKEYTFNERLEVGGEGEKEAYERFALVVFEPTICDRSQQNAKPPLRHCWTREDNGNWKESKLAP